jgi:alanyl-tRNA synthetase
LGIKKISFLSKNDNWWGPAGSSGPCGPDTEMFFDGVEIWNDVFMQYNKTKEGKYEQLKQKNVDTGMGVERVIALLNGKKSVYETACFLPIIKKIEELSGKLYGKNEKETQHMKIIADHIKASVFIIADGVIPSNIERGYIARRLIRRAIRHGRELGIKSFTEKLVEPIFEIYEDYDILIKNKKNILAELKKEEERFNKTLENGLMLFEKMVHDKKEINCKDSFLLYQSYGFPIEMINEIAREKGIKIDEKGFENECKMHQELSRTASAGQFKSGLADNSEMTTKLHTATHLLNQALREVLGKKDIYQKGSNITAERARFDFNFDRKLSDEELKKIEELVNKKINEKCFVIREELSLGEAKKKAHGIFDSKYGEKVSVYSIGDFSREICAGPHVSNTGDLGHFKIVKEESSGAGVRRIKAVLK